MQVTCRKKQLLRLNSDRGGSAECLIILSCIKDGGRKAHRADVDMLVAKEASRDAERDAAGGGGRSGTIHGQVQVAQAVGEGKACANAKKERSCISSIYSCYTEWRC